MKVYAIATKIHQTYGHGDYGDDIVIPIISGYDGCSYNPKLFTSKEKANKAATKDEVVVELNVI